MLRHDSTISRYSEYFTHFGWDLPRRILLFWLMLKFPFFSNSSPVGNLAALVLIDYEPLNNSSVITLPANHTTTSYIPFDWTSFIKSPLFSPAQKSHIIWECDSEVFKINDFCKRENEQTNRLFPLSSSSSSFFVTTPTPAENRWWWYFAQSVSQPAIIVINYIPSR